MADELTRAQAEAETIAAANEAAAAERELFYASTSNVFGTNSENFEEAKAKAEAAEAAADQAKATFMEISKELTDAIVSISDAADDDSLLRNPFDDFEIQAFVDPLTQQELRRLKNATSLVKLYKSEFDVLNTSPSESLIYIQPRLIFLQTEIVKLQVNEINPLLKKRSDAKDAFERRKAQSFAESQSKRNEVLDEFEAQIDKFEQFETKGLVGLSKRIKPAFEKAAKNFINDEPEILFICQYIVEGQIIGALLCFERYKGATHYELFKRNAFQFGSKFERILFLDKQSLAEETKHYIPYVRKVLGFKDVKLENVFIILDTELKKDRIYEYSVAAALVPNQANKIDYDLILESKNLLNKTTLSDLSVFTLFQQAGVCVTSPDYAWVLSAVNEGISFFGRAPSEQPLRTIIKNPTVVTGGVEVLVPKNINDVLSIFQDSVSLLGLAPSMEHLVSVLGGLPSEFMPALNAALDKDRSLFVYDSFREKLKKEAPVFQIVFDISETKDEDALKQLSQLDVVIPQNKGSENVSSILGLSAIFKFMNDMFIALTYSQDSFEKLVEIRSLIELNRKNEDSVESAVRNARFDYSNIDLSTEDAEVSNFYETQLGEPQIAESNSGLFSARGIIAR